MPEYIKHSVRGLMEFLKSAFDEMERIYEKYAPVTYAATLAKIKQFMSSMY